MERQILKLTPDEKRILDRVVNNRLKRAVVGDGFSGMYIGFLSYWILKRRDVKGLGPLNVKGLTAALKRFEPQYANELKKWYREHGIED